MGLRIEVDRTTGRGSGSGAFHAPAKVRLAADGCPTRSITVTEDA